MLILDDVRYVDWNTLGDRVLEASKVTGAGDRREVKSLVKAGSQVDERVFRGLLCSSKLENSAARGDWSGKVFDLEKKVTTSFDCAALPSPCCEVWGSFPIRLSSVATPFNTARFAIIERETSTCSTRFS